MKSGMGFVIYAMWSAFVVLLLGSPLGLAEETRQSLPPEKVLERAKLGRVDYIEVLGDLERLAPNLISGDEIYPYLFILDELKTIEKDLAIDDFVGSPLKVTAKTLTNESVKFLHLANDEEATLKVFFRWALDDVRDNAVRMQFVYTALLDDANVMQKWMDRTHWLQQVLLEVKSSYYVQSSLETLQAGVFKKLFSKPEGVDLNKLLLLIEKLISVQPLQEVLQFLEKRAYESSESQELLLVLDNCLALFNVAKTMKIPVPNYVLKHPGQISLLVLKKILKTQTPLTAEGSKKLYQMWDGPTHLELLQVLNEKTRAGISDPQLSFVFALAEALVEEMQSLGLIAEMEMAEKILTKAMVYKLGVASLEGLYEIEIGGVKDDLVIFHLGNGDLALSMAPVRAPAFSSPIFLSFSQIHFNTQRKTFEAIATPVDASDTSMSSIQFNWKNNRIEGMIGLSSQRAGFQGKKKSALPQYFAAKDSLPHFLVPQTELGGLYKAVDRKSGQEFELNIFQTKTGLSANLKIIKMGYFANFPFAFVELKNKGLHLTSSAVRSTNNVLHWRGRMRIEKAQLQGLTGDFLFGAKGIVYPNLQFYRTHE